MPKVELEYKDNFAIMRLNNGVTNAIDLELLDDLERCLDGLADNCRGLMLSGGEKFFSMGFYLPALLEMDRSGFSSFFYKFNDITLKLLTLDLPTCCAISGHAVAGGTILAMTCDVRVAARSRKLGLNKIRLGVPVPYLADLRLQQLTGPYQASRMSLSGDFVDSEQAVSLGLVDEVTDAALVESRAAENLTALLSLPQTAFVATKRYRTEPIRAAYEKAFKVKNELFIDCWFSEAGQRLLIEAAKKF